MTDYWHSFFLMKLHEDFIRLIKSNNNEHIIDVIVFASANFRLVLLMQKLNAINILNQIFINDIC